MIIDHFNQSLVNKPSGLAEEDWFSMDDVFPYLSNPFTARVPLHVSQGNTNAYAFIYSMLVPETALHEKWQLELEDQSVDPSHSWGYGTRDEGGVNIACLYPPYTEHSSSVFDSGHPITILRSHPLQTSDEPYVEISQEITHTHGLYWSHAHSAYIRLDELGDPEECIRIRAEKRDIAVDILPDLLKLHLFLGHYVLIRFFSFGRWNVEDLVITEQSREKKVANIEDQHIHATVQIIGFENGGKHYNLRGFQCLSVPRGEETSLRQELEGEKPREYCTFTIKDWKNKRVVECSSDPESFASYFTKSDLPYETSPAFFSREVLRKYKDNPEKYTIKESIIYCRGAWQLQYGINDVGQVHAYICYLSYLPHKEQLHWKQYNEEPRAGLSATTVARDFYAEFVTDPFDPLRELKALLESFPSIEGECEYGSIWMPPSKEIVKQLIYMTGESKKEWEEDIHLLDKAVVEGLKAKSLRKIVQSLSTTLPNIERLGSIKLLGELLRLKDIAEDIRGEVITPLEELHEIRSKISGHREGEDASKLIASILRAHKTFSKHERHLVGKLYTAMRIFAELIQKDILTL